MKVENIQKASWQLEKAVTAVMPLEFSNNY